MTKTNRPSLLFLLIALLTIATCPAAETQHEPVDLVYPQLDTDNSRWFFFSSACRPFGLVNLSPDTEVKGAWGSGYRHKVENIKGFSHIHAWQLSGLSVMPVSYDNDSSEILIDHSSDFSHKTELIKPGYHLVHLVSLRNTSRTHELQESRIPSLPFRKRKHPCSHLRPKWSLGPLSLIHI